MDGIISPEHPVMPLSGEVLTIRSDGK